MRSRMMILALLLIWFCFAVSPVFSQDNNFYSTAKPTRVFSNNTKAPQIPYFLANAYRMVRLASQPQVKSVQVVPESSTLMGFGAALALDGIGVAGAGWYLRRRYNREAAKRYARRQALRLPVFLDVIVSILLLIVLSPLLVTLTILGGVISERTVIFRKQISNCSRTKTNILEKGEMV